MATPFKIFSNDDRVQQFIVQFACRIPIRNELSAGEKSALENLRDLNPETFQLFNKPPFRNPLALFEVLRQHTIDANTIQMPSFVFSRDSFSFIFPIKLMSQFIAGVDSMDTRTLNKKVSPWIVEVENAVSNCRCQRAGKIYEFVLGPFTCGDKKKIFDKLSSRNLDDVGEFNMVFARYLDVRGTVYNIQTAIGYLQPQLNADFVINVRADINNRKLLQSMEPVDIERVWAFADSVIAEHLTNILDIT